MTELMTDKKIYPSQLLPRKSIRLSDEQADNWDTKLVKWMLSDENISIVRQLKAGNLLLSDNLADNSIKTPNPAIRKLLAFLNEVKDTFFATENKFYRFIEILERHLSMDELAALEAEL